MWTRFTNIFPVPGRPEPILFAYVEAPMKKAKDLLEIEMQMRQLDSSGLTAIDEHRLLEQATGYERGCPCLYNPMRRSWRWLEPGEKYPNFMMFYPGYGKYETLDAFLSRPDVVLVRHDRD